MADLVSRLLAAIEETERFAREAANDVGERWSDGGKMGESVYQEDSNGYVACGPYDYMSWELRRFIAHNDPASVLRRCAVDRELVEWCEGWQRTFRGPIPEGHSEEAAGHFRMAAEYLITRLQAAYGISVEEETTWE